MNVAIIDIGSNNIKLEIHRVDSEGRSELIYEDKVPARLGHEVFLTRQLAEENIEAAIQGITQFAKIIENLKCKSVIALGTAALREADSEPFVKRVEKECGITIKVVSGIEEARLVYLGALANISFKGRTFFLNDIGGGSTEISISDHQKIHYIESLRLGTVRLKELFETDHGSTKLTNHNKDSHTKFNTDIITNYVEKVFSSFTKAIQGYSFEMGMCTGGTARNLMEIIRFNSSEKIDEEDGIPVLETSVLKKQLKEMKKMSYEGLEKLKGLDKQRIDIIIPGAILLLKMLETLNIKRSFVLQKGLRDGALAELVHKKINKRIYQERQEASRELGLRILNNKYNSEKQHAEQCAHLSLQLFDLLQDEHGLNSDYKDILLGGALLHDVGSYVSYYDHHKHSEYLIMNSQLLGFSLREKLWISLVARYHRKGFPKSSHKAYSNLNEEEKDMILRLSAIVRIADSLDRSYKSVVKAIELNHSSEKKIKMGVLGKGDLSLELWSVDRKKKYFEKVFGKSLEVILI